MKIISRMFSTLILFSLLATAGVAQAEIVMITNKASKLHGITLDEVGKLYLAQSRAFSNGNRAHVADYAPGTPIRAQFYKKVLKMSDKEVTRYWSKRKFTRKLKPPKIISGDEAMKQWVASTPDSLGYTDSKALDGSVKVLLIIP